MAIQGDVGWKWTVVRRKLEMMKLLKRLMLMSGDRLTKKIFIWDWHHKGRTWSWYVRSVLKSTGQDAVCDIDPSAEEPDIDFNTLFDQVDQELMNVEIEKWHAEMGRQSKLHIYRELKTDFIPEPYVVSNMSKSSRSIIDQLRTGTLPLMVEVGRFQQKKREERTCTYCKGETIEDEMHFIFSCPLYANFRDDFMDRINNRINIANKSNMEKMGIFMEHSIFGSFIRDCYYKRSDYIFNTT